MGIQALDEDEDSTPPGVQVPRGDALSSSQPLSFGTALVLVAPRVVSGLGAIGLALPIAYEVPNLLRSVGAATLVAAETGKWMPVWVSLGVLAGAIVLVLAAANKRGLRDLAGVISAVKGLRGK